MPRRSARRKHGKQPNCDYSIGNLTRKKGTDMEVYFLAGKRTPLGSLLGELSTIPAPELAAVAIKGALKASEISDQEIQQVTLGQVLQAGVGQAPARQALISAGISEQIPATTVNKVCGSGMEAAIQIARSIQLGEVDAAIAGGMENMSLAPHLIPQFRTGQKFGEAVVRDAMQWDGLRDAYSDRPMGNCAEECAKKFDFSREAQDEYSRRSFTLAQEAQSAGVFQSEISPVEVSVKKKKIWIENDEGPGRANFEKMSQLRPAFDSAGTITAANASSINDGAAALVMGGAKFKDKAKFQLLAYAGHAQNPTWFTTAPIEATRKVLSRAKLGLSDIDLFEVNEAFAVVPMAFQKELHIPIEKLNVHGGAVALGHPIGCSGARIIVTLMNALEILDKKRGLATICLGGGEALAIVIERLQS